MAGFQHLGPLGAIVAMVLGSIPTTAFAAGPAKVVLVTDAAVPTVRVEPLESKSLMIPACRGVVWQRFDEKEARYVPISKRSCGVMSPGQIVPAQGKSFAVDGPVSDGDVVRAVVVTGLECTVGKPFALADCTKVVVLEGSTMTVRGAGG
ncbi:MAG TPA: hypothetical protein DFR83_12295 [Deltaproteobacteria bacterium]|nr:hypothetical protein [Deltaproteobacteria bacterium]